MKFLKIAMAMLLCFSLLTSCSGDSSEKVIWAEGTSSADITANMYNYWASTSKANFMYSYTDIKDTDTFWKSEYEEGKTYAQYLDDLVLEDIKTTAVCLSLYNEYRLALPDSVKEAIDNEIESYLQEYADGNKNTLNRALSYYGANTEILKAVKTAEAKRTLVYEYLFGENGEMTLDEKALEEYYQNNYYRFQIIYINNKYEYVTDKDGNYTTNNDGTYVTRALTGEALEKKNATVKTVTDALSGGSDFDSLYNEYSEVKSYENGYYFTSGGSYADAVFYKLIADIAKIQPGETTVSEYDSGTYIMKRLHTDAGAWKNKANSDFFDNFQTLASNASFRLFIKEKFEMLTVNDSVISKYSVADVNVNDRF